ncbi:hypothetical protein [Orlajensenia leifsoniae]|jgi:hypothetical protein|uniref:Uncharacterized protein n=1 Tax=Orlajensenia leifsoniae TaxID=2561933 RepID=A0A4Y9RAX7_9MICO|nr:hypothetical protein [Leifsonia flava]TFW00287.1 hypothetical protein E4M00_03675 [Leifsonia flava]
MNDEAKNNPEGDVKPDGLGGDGTIPNHPGGIGVGVGDESHFNPEEDAPEADPAELDAVKPDDE